MDKRKPKPQPKRSRIKADVARERPQTADQRPLLVKHLLPEGLRHALTPVLSEAERARLSPAGRVKLEQHRQSNVRDALDHLEAKFELEAGRPAAIAQGFIEGATRSDNAIRGRKVQEGGRKGHQKAYGSPQKIADEHRALVAEVDQCLQANEGMTLTRATELLSKSHRLHAKSIARIYRQVKHRS